MVAITPPEINSFIIRFPRCRDTVFRRQHHIRRYIVVITDLPSGPAARELHEDRSRFRSECRKETVVHPFAESDAAYASVHSDRRHDSYINFFYLFRTGTRFEYTKFLTFQRVSKWYHPEACTFHKREIDPPPLAAQPVDQRADIRLRTQRPEQQGGTPFCAPDHIVQATLHPFAPDIPAVLRHRPQAFEACPPEFGLGHSASLCRI
jgi:hypothetical protein